ncbi:hypothetical protein B0H19DRAFT_680155 [Mycena capillaripes]|nr:hypothetical protein B0H19DRAFT_680155 [Mycena capillaripes]
MDLTNSLSVSRSLSRPQWPRRERPDSPAPTPPTSFKEEYLLTLDHPGSRPMDVYDATLSPSRAAVRRALIAQIRVESVLVAKMMLFALPSSIHILSIRLLWAPTRSS